MACGQQGDVSFCSTTETCASVIPMLKNFTIQIDTIDYSVPPEAITSSTPGGCKVLVEYDESLGKYAYLGVPFLENFVVAYNYPNGIIQFAISPNAEAGTNIGNGQPWKEYIDQLSGWEIFWLVLFFFVCFVAIVMALYCFWKCFAAKTEEREAKHVLYSQVQD